VKETVAVVFDFDDTLAPDTTSGFLENWGEPPQDFWNDKVNLLLDHGWDPIPAYLYRLIEASKNRPAGERITRKRLADFGRRVRFHNGVTRIFSKLKETAGSVHPSLRLEFYVISSGIREIITGTKISSQFKHIWACDFHYHSRSGEILFPKNVISFTDKTRYLFQISKGFVGPDYENRPFEVNRRVGEENIRIPFEQMIYVGDGYTDVPCFSLIRKQQGIAIGVFDPARKEKWRQAWGFIEEDRVSNLVPADYSKGSALEQSLLMAVDSMARKVALRGRTYQG